MSEFSKSRGATYGRRVIPWRVFGAVSGALIVGAFFLAMSPKQALACACGCGIFDVGVSTLMPADSDSGFSVWFRYDYMNQNRNWEGSSSAPHSDNGDQEIVTSFYTVGGQYMINRDWTVMAELPIFHRRLTTTDDGNGDVTGIPNSVYTGQIVSQGDLQLTGMYTGISPDLSTGLTFGVKLPTGNFTGPTGPAGGLEFDRDSLPGTGSTDLMVGGYHIGGLNADNTLAYFVQARYQFAVLVQDNYRPGNELDTALGVTYNLGEFGQLSKVAPVLQLLGSWRRHDDGIEADSLNSGYKRVLIAPGIEVRIDKVRLYTDVELPIYQFTNSASSYAIEQTQGQLVAPFLLKMQASYDF
jgi:hypothetical protein